MNSKLFVLLIFICNFSKANLKTEPVIASVKAKLYELAINKTYRDEDFPTLSSQQIFSVLEDDGRFKDISYNNIDNGTSQPSEHWMRLYNLSLLYQTKGKYFHNKELGKKIVNSVRFWMQTKPKIESYWWNSIGIPLAMGKVFILMEDELPEKLIKDAIKVFNLGVLEDHYEYFGIATGQNLLWLTYVHVYSACLVNDIEGLKRAFVTSAREIVITEKEGIQPDYSFHQHGPQFYTFGYGKTFSLTAAHLIYLAQNTPYQFSKEKINIISHYILDGQQWATRNQFLEYTAMGREVSRNVSDLNSMLFAIKLMSKADLSRKLEYDIFYKQLNKGYRTHPLIGNRYFEYSDFMVQQRKGYYFSVKAASKKSIASESGNGENTKGYYQGNGTYYITKTGKEYASIFPLFNWKQLPGSLCKQDSLPLPLIDFGRTNFGNTNFVYGVSDGLYGAFSYDYQKDGVQAKRSWFFFDKAVICLVAGLNYKDNSDLYQSVNQCYANGDVWVNNKKIKMGQYQNEKVEKIYHDSIGYVFDSIPYLKKVQVEERTGAWFNINRLGSKELVSKSIFSLNINLGKELSNQHFMYAIMPAIAQKDFSKYRLNSHIKILENNQIIQAVFHKDLKQVQVVFYQPGTLELPWDHRKLKFNQPGLALIKLVNNQLIITLNPQLNSLTYKINVIDGLLENKLFQIL
jgi:chondroitin AC lyase